MDVARSLLARTPIVPLDSLRDANNLWREYRVSHGAAATTPKILTDPNHNAKFAKTYRKSGTFLYGLALAQADTSGVGNVCRFSTPECRAGCVSYAGRGSYSTVQAGRARRTGFLVAHPEAFLTILMHEIEAVWNKHGSEGRVRLNTFSDIPWEDVHRELFTTFPRLRMYDYTKWPLTLRPDTPKNYRLIRSASEKMLDSTIVSLLNEGQNVAVVFDVARSKPLPKRYLGFRVIDGDKSDDRYSDPRPVIVGLRSKGRMRKQGGRMPRKVA